jgi:hypothetical protein
MDNISNSNIKSILEFYLKNNNNFTLDYIYDFYQPVQGYLYCLFNEIFKFYGDDLYKCGNSIDTDKRLSQYSTSYPTPSQILLTSDSFFDKSFAETLLFFYLKDFKFKPNREFIKCDFNIIEDAFDKVKLFFSIYNTKHLLIDFLLTQNNFKIYFTKPIYNISDKDKFINNYDNIQNISNILNFKNDILFNDDNDFIEYISKYLFQFDKNQFNIIFKSNYDDFSKYKYILDKIYSLFWLEDLLNIKRLQINDINDNINVDYILNEFICNIDKSYILFKGIESKNKTISSIHNKINKIKNTKHFFKFNYFKKFIADCYNNFIHYIIHIQKKTKKHKNINKIFYTFDI